jgi:uncharacterized Tic20 family protein
MRMEENKGCRNQLIFGAVWMTSGIINVILLRIVLKESTALSSLVPFMLPPLSLILGVRIMQGGDLIRWIFRRKTSIEKLNESEKPSRKYGTSVVFASLLIFFIGGFLTSIFVETHPNHYSIYLLFGFLWGLAWYALLQNRIIDHLFDVE